VRSRELASTVHSERVIPDHPAPRREAKILAKHLDLGSVFIANRKPESPRRLENPADLLDPRLCPREILGSTFFVVINVVLVPNIERWICKCESDAFPGKLAQRSDAVPFDNRVEKMRRDAAPHDRPLLLRAAQDNPRHVR